MSEQKATACYFTDKTALSEPRITGDGYLAAEIRSARTGIQRYTGQEMSRADMPFVDVYRDPSEVFDKAALASMAHRPVVVGHPDGPVTADNWKELAVGSTGETAGREVAQDGEFVRVPLALMDGAAVKSVQSGENQVSWGYVCDLVWGDGVTPDGQKYHARQTNIRANHLAVVPKGRAGDFCRIGDGVPWGKTPSSFQIKEPTMATESTRTVVVDGLSVLTTDAGAQAIEKLQADKTKLADDHAKIVADHATELGKKDAEIKDLQDKAVTEDALDAMVADRADVLAKAKAIVKDFDGAGKTNAQIRLAVVTDKMGDGLPKDPHEEYVRALFDGLSAKKKSDPFRAAMKDGAGKIEAADAWPDEIFVKAGVNMKGAE